MYTLIATTLRMLEPTIEKWRLTMLIQMTSNLLVSRNLKTPRD
jgi:hypothetical protein